MLPDATRQPGGRRSRARLFYQTVAGKREWYQTTKSLVVSGCQKSMSGYFEKAKTRTQLSAK